MKNAIIGEGVLLGVIILRLLVQISVFLVLEFASGKQKMIYTGTYAKENAQYFLSVYQKIGRIMLGNLLLLVPLEKPQM